MTNGREEDMGHRWTPEEDALLLDSIDKLKDQGFKVKGGEIWSPLVGVLAVNSVRVTPASASSRWYRLERRKKKEEEGEAAAVPSDSRSADETLATYLRVLVETAISIDEKLGKLLELSGRREGVGLAGGDGNSPGEADEGAKHDG